MSVSFMLCCVVVVRKCGRVGEVERIDRRCRWSCVCTKKRGGGEDEGIL
jgi:hypothetical protein